MPVRIRNNLKQARRRHKAGDLQQAAGLYRKLLERVPDCASAHLELGHILLATGHPDQAHGHFNRAIESGLRSPTAFAANAAALLTLRRYPDAETMARAAVALEAGNLDGQRALIRALIHQGKHQAALSGAEQLANHPAADASDRILVAWVLASLGHYDAAIAQGRKALALDASSAEARYQLSRLYRNIQQWRTALDLADQAVALAPDNPEYIAMQADMLELLGRHEQALDLVRPLVNQPRPPSTLAIHVYTRLAGKAGKQDHALQLLERATADPTLPFDMRHANLYLLGTTYDSRGDYDKAFAAIDKANKLRPSSYNHEQLVTYLQRITASFGRDQPGVSVAGDQHPVTPIFIVGMPRSGTSLTEKILARHPDVSAGGETIHLPMLLHRDLPELLGSEQEFPDCMAGLTSEIAGRAAAIYLDKLCAAQPGDASRITDKRPMNFMYLGAIARLFPQASIIHCTRNPLDIGLSCYFANFASASEMGFSQDLRQIGDYFRHYQQLMAHWRGVLPLPILDLSYEALVSSPETEIAKLLAHCDLPWHDDCLSPDRATDVTMTASYSQVRQPINTRSIGRWRHYEQHLQPLQKALAITNSKAA